MRIFGTGTAPSQGPRRTYFSALRIIWMLPLSLFAFSAITDCRGSAIQEQLAAVVAPANLWMFSPLPTAAPVEGVEAEKVNLGRHLYFETHLSENNSLSCNSCHDLANYGADKGHAVSLGHDKRPGGRNSPTVYNAVVQFVQFWDGRAPTLAAQASGPMMNPVEMGMSGPDTVLAVLRANPEYTTAFKKAYPESKDPVTMENVTDAIAQFESGLLTPAPWDDYLRGNENALTTEQKEGLRVYMQSGCSACHAGTGMGGNSYQKLGAFKDWPDQKTDRGRIEVTKQERDQMYFKVPLLRNVEQTGPYFHNGQVATLEEAVRLMGQYQTGHELNPAEVQSILSFLHALTGPLPRDYVQPPPQTAPGLQKGE
jgi:cytochrome c peroxidase